MQFCFLFTGKVVRADISEGSDGKSKGHGTVQFETPLEAVNAVCILFNLVCSAMQDILFIYLYTCLFKYLKEMDFTIKVGSLKITYNCHCIAIVLTKSLTITQVS